MFISYIYVFDTMHVYGNEFNALYLLIIVIIITVSLSRQFFFVRVYFFLFFFISCESLCAREIDVCMSKLCKCV